MGVSQGAQIHTLTMRNHKKTDIAIISKAPMKNHGTLQARIGAPERN